MFPAFDKIFFIDMVILHGEPPWLSVCEIPNEWCIYMYIVQNDT